MSRSTSRSVRGMRASPARRCPRSMRSTTSARSGGAACSRRCQRPRSDGTSRRSARGLRVGPAGRGQPRRAGHDSRGGATRSPPGRDYLELPLTRMARSEAFSAFVVDIVLTAERFATAYNAELAEYRAVNKTRSPLQPFPDLARDGSRVELPFWVLARHIVGEQRGANAAAKSWCSVAMTAGRLRCCPTILKRAIEALQTSGVVLRPRRSRSRCSCGCSSATCSSTVSVVVRYDRVTDDVCRRYYGVEPPAFVVASITMYLPLGMHVIAAEEVVGGARAAQPARPQPGRAARRGGVRLRGRAEPCGRARRREGRARARRSPAPGADKKTLGSADPRGQRRARRAARAAQARPWRRSFASLEAQRRRRRYSPTARTRSASGRRSKSPTRRGRTGVPQPDPLARGAPHTDAKRIAAGCGRSATIARFDVVGTAPRRKEASMSLPVVDSEPLHRLRHLRRRVPEQLLRPRGRRRA